MDGQSFNDFGKELILKQTEAYQRNASIHRKFLIDIDKQITEADNILALDKLQKKIVDLINQSERNLERFPGVLCNGKNLEKQSKEKFIKDLRETIKGIESKIDVLKMELSPFVYNSSDILRIKKAFEGILWEANINEEEFLGYWRLGKKTNSLPLLKNKQNQFVYLLNLLKITPNHRKEEISIDQKYTYPELEETFGVENIKEKRCRCRKSTGFDYKELKTKVTNLGIKIPPKL